jgi:ribosomal protein S1
MRRVTTAYEKQTVITATVVEQVKGGLIVDLGLRGFVPASQIRLKPVRNLEEFVANRYVSRCLNSTETDVKLFYPRKKYFRKKELIKRKNSYRS